MEADQGTYNFWQDMYYILTHIHIYTYIQAGNDLKDKRKKLVSYVASQG